MQNCVSAIPSKRAPLPTPLLPVPMDSSNRSHSSESPAMGTNNSESSDFTKNELVSIARRQREQIEAQRKRMSALQKQITLLKRRLSQLPQTANTREASEITQYLKPLYDEQEKHLQPLRQQKSQFDQLKAISANLMCEITRVQSQQADSRRNLVIFVHRMDSLTQRLTLLHKCQPLLAKKECHTVLPTLFQTLSQFPEHSNACRAMHRLCTIRQQLEQRLRYMLTLLANNSSIVYTSPGVLISNTNQQSMLGADSHHLATSISTQETHGNSTSSNSSSSSSLTGQSSTSPSGTTMEQSVRTGISTISLHGPCNVPQLRYGTYSTAGLSATGMDNMRRTAPVTSGVSYRGTSSMMGQEIPSSLSSHIGIPSFIIGQCSPPVGRRPIPVVTPPMSSTSVSISTNTSLPISVPVTSTLPPPGLSVNAMLYGSQEHLAGAPKVMRRAASCVVKYANTSVIRDTYLHSSPTHKEDLLKKLRETAASQLSQQLLQLQQNCSINTSVPLPIPTTSTNYQYSSMPSLTLSAPLSRRYLESSVSALPSIKEQRPFVLVDSTSEANSDQASSNETPTTHTVDSGISSLQDSGGSTDFPLITNMIQTSERNEKDNFVSVDTLCVTTVAPSSNTIESSQIVSSTNSLIHEINTDLVKDITDPNRIFEKNLPGSELLALTVEEVDRPSPHCLDEEGSVKALQRHHHHLHADIPSIDTETNEERVQEILENVECIKPEKPPKIIESCVSIQSTEVQTVKSILQKRTTKVVNTMTTKRNIRFQPLTLLLDASLDGDLELVKKVTAEMTDVSEPNEDGITALHNSICAGHDDISRFLILQCAADVNAQETDGWTPLHCAASCASVEMCRVLIENGASLLVQTTGDGETALSKCTEQSDGFLSSVLNESSIEGNKSEENKSEMSHSDNPCEECLKAYATELWKRSDGEQVYAVFNYKAEREDELNLYKNQELVIVEKEVDTESEWFRARCIKTGKVGLVPKCFVSLYPVILERKWPLQTPPNRFL